LKKAGWLVLEIGHDQAKAVTNILKETGAYEEIAVFQDLAKHDRIVIAQIAAKKKPQ
jgi:release factor glutamine methyltransferase